MASRPSEPPHLPGTPPAVDDIEARIMREDAQTPPLLEERTTSSRRRLEVVAGRKAGQIAGTAVRTVSQLRTQLPVAKQRTQSFVQDSSRRIRDYAYEKPINAVLGAAGIGFVVGFLLRLVGRRRSG